MLVQVGAVSQDKLDQVLSTQQQTRGMPSVAKAKIGDLLESQAGVAPEVVAAALGKQQKIRENAPSEERYIRVQADRLDAVINLLGELVIAGAGATLLARESNQSSLIEANLHMHSLIEEIRNGTLGLRMVPVGETFSRFRRVVRDTASSLGKEVNFEIVGGDAELDKSMVEKIADPLMHLVRNSLDHGIESAELRAERGKPAQGTLTLNAFHDSGSIVITVQDDGGGLNRERVLAKAIERGLVEPGQHLSDSDIYALIFEPGFSTAEKVTNLSGRGVGMDVVKRNIAALRGTVGISSKEGQGTTVTVRLPLTLAIIDGFLVGVGKAVYAIPLDMIEECVTYSAEPEHDYTNLRDQVLPFIRLRTLFCIAGQPAKGENIVVLRYGGQKVGLVVDSLLGEFQTVIKPLGSMFNQVKCISGSTILGSGDVGLILDVPALIRQVADRSAGAHTATLR
jgi:two-component system chemotaxis sensor kinase CheA